MSIVIDLIVVAVVILFVLICAKKGFVKTLIESVGLILAIVLAFLIAQPVSEMVYDNFVEPSIVESVKENTEETLENNGFNLSVDDLPDFVVENAAEFGIDLDEVFKGGQSVVVEGEEALAESISKTVKPMAVKLISAIAFLILAIVLVIVFKFLAKVLNALFSFSLVGKVNKVLGGVLGFAKGTAFAIMICSVISMVVSLGIEFFFFTAENIENTLLFNVLANIITF